MSVFGPLQPPVTSASNGAFGATFAGCGSLRERPERAESGHPLSGDLIAEFDLKWSLLAQPDAAELGMRVRWLGALVVVRRCYGSF